MKTKIRCFLLLGVVSSLFLPLLYFQMIDQDTLTHNHSWIGKQNDKDLLEKYTILNGLYTSFYSEEIRKDFDVTNTSNYALEDQTTINEVLSNYEHEVMSLIKQTIIPYEYVELKQDEPYTISFGTLQLSEKDNGMHHFDQIFHMNNDIVKEAAFSMDQQTKKITNIIITNSNVVTYTNEQIKSLLWNYITYLGLHEIDDWIYNNGFYESYRARLQIYLHMQDNGATKLLTIGICAIGMNEQNYRINQIF